MNGPRRSLAGISIAFALCLAHGAGAEELEPLDPSSQEPRPVDPADGPLPLPISRRVEVGALIAVAHRPADSGGVRNQPGLGGGGYARIELADYLGLRISARQEWLPVTVEPGGFDYGGREFEFDFHQPSLEVLQIGLQAEPTWVVHPRVRVFGIVGLAFVRSIAHVPVAPGFRLDGMRGANELNVPLGLGVSYEIVPDWLRVGLAGSYGIGFDRRGRAYEPLQAIVDGEIVYLAPLPTPFGLVDVLLSFGMIL